MLEIYNEQVNDLLNKQVTKGGLQVRQHPSQGSFYAEGLKRIPVGSYKDIESRIEQGTANRTVSNLMSIIFMILFYLHFYLGSID